MTATYVYWDGGLGKKEFSEVTELNKFLNDPLAFKHLGVILLQLNKDEASVDLLSGKIGYNGFNIDLEIPKNIMKRLMPNIIPACLNRCLVQYSSTRQNMERIHVIGWKSSLSGIEYVRQIALHEDGRFEVWKK
jgi:hypothetical protein